MKKSCNFSIIFVVALFVWGVATGSNTDDCRIVITTPGYVFVYQYDTTNFESEFKRDFKMNASFQAIDSTNELILNISGRKYRFIISDSLPVARLQYNRNNRLFTAVGLNSINYNDSLNLLRYTLPTFRGTVLSELVRQWQPQIEKRIVNKSMFRADSNRFIVEAEIDTNGMIGNMVEISGAERQASKFVIDCIYDIAQRGWSPATTNGHPCKSLIQLIVEIKRESY